VGLAEFDHPRDEFAAFGYVAKLSLQRLIAENHASKIFESRVEHIKASSS
jgi:hypothetical protein